MLQLLRERVRLARADVQLAACKDTNRRFETKVSYVRAGMVERAVSWNRNTRAPGYAALEERVGGAGNAPCLVKRGRNDARHYRRDRARSRKRIASAWCRIVGDDVPSSSVRSETPPIAAVLPAERSRRRAPTPRRRDAAARLGSVPPRSRCTVCVFVTFRTSILGPVSHYARDLWRT